MPTPTRRSVATLGVVAAFAALTTVLPTSAVARPDDGRVAGPSTNASSTATTSAAPCPLKRLGRQLVRCDDLTGAGVRAPLHIPLWTAEPDTAPAPQSLDDVVVQGHLRERPLPEQSTDAARSWPSPTHVNEGLR